jgi:hypothetical protein
MATIEEAGSSGTSPNAKKTAAQLAAEAAAKTAANAAPKFPTTELGGIKVPGSYNPAVIDTPLSDTLVNYNQNTGLSYDPNAKLEDLPGGIAGTGGSGTSGSGTSGSGSGAGNGTGSGSGSGPSSEMQDAYQRLYDEFNGLGLGALVSDAKDLLMKATSISAMPDALRNTGAYKQRFSANDARIAKGLAALSPAQYLAKEDAYQNLMRNYGLPSSYYTVGQYGKQEGFDKLLANDVSAVELEDRISTAQQRVLNANPEVLNAIKSFYGDSITNGDILGYVLNPQQGLTDIKKKVTAAEIQGAANTFGLNKITAESTPDQIKAMEARANALAGYGINKATAQQGFAQVAEMTPIGSQLADIYKQTPYTQQTAESEVFGTSGAAAAKEQRKKLTALEQAQFGGSSGVGALGRDKAAYGLTQGQTGLY